MREVIMKLFRCGLQDIGKLENVKIRQKESWHEPIPADAIVAIVLYGMILLFFMFAFMLLAK